MPINLCKCGIRFAVGLMRCPRCKKIAPQYAALAKKEEIMPRITVASGPSNAGAVPGEVGYIERAEHKAAEVAAEVRAEAKAEVHTVVDWTSKSLAHLRVAAKDRGLSAAGPKADLAARLTEHDAAKAPAAEAAPAEAAEATTQATKAE